MLVYPASVRIIAAIELSRGGKVLCMRVSMGLKAFRSMPEWRFFLSSLIRLIVLIFLISFLGCSLQWERWFKIDSTRVSRCCQYVTLEIPQNSAKLSPKRGKKAEKHKKNIEKLTEKYLEIAKTVEFHFLLIHYIGSIKRGFRWLAIVSVWHLLKCLI